MIKGNDTNRLVCRFLRSAAHNAILVYWKGDRSITENRKSSADGLFSVTAHTRSVVLISLERRHERFFSGKT